MGMMGNKHLRLGIIDITNNLFGCTISLVNDSYAEISITIPFMLGSPKDINCIFINGTKHDIGFKEDSGDTVEWCKSYDLFKYTFYVSCDFDFGGLAWFYENLGMVGDK